MITLLSLGWLLTIVILFFYSFTQIDLGLTLTRISWWQIIQKKFQYIGYFNRPLSTGLYLGILLFLFTFYFLLFLSVKRKWLHSKQIWLLILMTAGVLWFAYNAFSYDLFNYIFDARIVTFYHQNPYQHKALDYLGDPMLGFMHWTHRYYPYGLLWLVFTVPLSFLGWQKLVPTMILFKGLAVLGYLGSCWFIDKMLAEIKPKERLMGLTIFAFSPLVIIESLVSAHNDILMMMLALGAFWFLFKKKTFLAWLMLFLSIGIKFATAFLLPAFLLATIRQFQEKKVNWQRIWLFSFWLMAAALLAAVKRSELKPWYLLYLWPFVSLLSPKPIFGLTTIFSSGLLLHYAPFLYLGNWDPPVPTIKLGLTLSSLLIGIGFIFLSRFNKTPQGLKH